MNATGRTSQIPALDGVRGLALLFVLVFHSVEIWRHPDLGPVLNIAQDAARSLWFGVDLFFVLSGFLITRILLAARQADHYFARFYWRRSLRIFPAYFLYLALAFLFLAWQSGDIRELIQPAHLSYWVYLQNWVISLRGYDSFRPLSHLWSLAVEEQFYIVWPFLVLWLSPRKLLRITLLMLIAAILVRSYLVARDAYTVGTYVSTITRMDTLAAGAMLALVEQNATWRSWLARQASKFAVAGLSVMIAIMFWRHGYEIRDSAVRLVGFAANILFCAGLIATVAFNDGRVLLARLFSWRGLRWVGRRGYAGYLLHWPITLLAAHFIRLQGTSGGRAIILTLLIVLAATLVTAELSWHLYEKHWLSLKERFPASP